MEKRGDPIPVNTLADIGSTGIAIERNDFRDLNILENFSGASKEVNETHRHDRHSFFLLENGIVSIEIDFEQHVINAPAVIYVHPAQVHRTIALDSVIVSSWAINDENLNPEYLKLLEGLNPAKPLPLTEDTFSMITEAVSLCRKFSERTGDKLYRSLLKDSCNALTALVISLYLEQVKPADRLSRAEAVTRAFKELLECDYTTVKRPSDYAQKLHISAPYLNECVKSTTGHSSSYHIQQRIVLEAKRLLYHSDSSVKEIAVILGYDDYPYFSRLFTKVAGMAALAFRRKNRN